MPKGVAITHSSAFNTIEDINRRFAIVASDRVLALSSLWFDLSVYDIFGMFSVGGAIVLPDAAHEKEPDHWVELIRRHGVTLWNSVPALLQMLVEYESWKTDQPNLSLQRTLRLVLLSGDWIPLALPAEIDRLFGDVPVISLGGATEAAIWSIAYPIEALDARWKSIPYGRPLRNQNIYILDDNLRSKPLWVSGEICIAGEGLALGYWRDPDKTAESFVHSKSLNKRVYRTGDLGRYMADGTIEFLGRVDLQTKINGHRIEAGDIEAALQRYPNVISSAVAVISSGTGTKQLGGAFVASCDISIDSLRKHLTEQLPIYMIPTLLRQVGALPLTRNGKVDRGAVAALVAEPVRTATLNRAPTQIEASIIEGWIEILGRQEITINDNFFALGGDSILAARLLARFQKKYGVSLRLRKFFDQPTPSGLASLIVDSIGNSDLSGSSTPFVRASHKSLTSVIEEINSNIPQSPRH